MLNHMSAPSRYPFHAAAGVAAMADCQYDWSALCASAGAGHSQLGRERSTAALLKVGMWEPWVDGTCFQVVVGLGLPLQRAQDACAARRARVDAHHMLP